MVPLIKWQNRMKMLFKQFSRHTVTHIKVFSKSFFNENDNIRFEMIFLTKIEVIEKTMGSGKATAHVNACIIVQ